MKKDIIVRIILKRDYNFNLRDEAWDDSSNNASWEKREEGQPFFSIFNFNITHESEIWKRDKEKLKVDPNNLTVPPVFPDDSISRHALAVNYSNLVEMDKQMGLIIKNLKDQGLYDNTYIFFIVITEALFQDIKEQYMKQDQRSH